MGFVLSKPKKSEPKEFEQILESLEEEIRRLQVELKESKITERHLKWTLLQYSLPAYAMAIAWQYLFRPHFTYEYFTTSIHVHATFMAMPILIYSVRRGITWHYQRTARHLERRLAGCRGKQKAKLEELKNMTAYYQTKGLLERFDPEKSPAVKITKPENHPKEPQSKEPKKQHRSEAPVVVAPTWFDRLMDSLVGEQRASKYALICAHCHAHNGLTRPEDLDYTQYTCPNCKQFNPARLQRSVSPVDSALAMSDIQPTHLDSRIIVGSSSDDTIHSEPIPSTSPPEPEPEAKHEEIVEPEDRIVEQEDRKEEITVRRRKGRKA